MDEVIDILFDGSREEMENIRCTQCDGTIQYSITDRNMRIICMDCGLLCSLYRFHYTPNCLKLFGPQHTFTQ